MNAFFSGTDNANENMTQFYAVWGQVTKEEPAFIFRWVCGDKKMVCSPDVLIDWPKAVFSETTITTKEQSLTLVGDTELIDTDETYAERIAEPVESVVTKEELIKGPFKAVDYPEDWFGQHTTNAYRYANYSYGKNTIGTRSTSPSGRALGIDYDGYDNYGNYGYGNYDYYDDPRWGFDDPTIPQVTNKKINKKSDYNPRIKGPGRYK